MTGFSRARETSSSVISSKNTCSPSRSIHSEMSTAAPSAPCRPRTRSPPVSRPLTVTEGPKKPFSSARTSTEMPVSGWEANICRRNGAATCRRRPATSCPRRSFSAPPAGLRTPRKIPFPTGAACPRRRRSAHSPRIPHPPAGGGRRRGRTRPRGRQSACPASSAASRASGRRCPARRAPPWAYIYAACRGPRGDPSGPRAPAPASAPRGAGRRDWRWCIPATRRR